RNLRIAGALGGEIEEQSGIHLRIIATLPALEQIEHRVADILGRIEPVDGTGAIGLQMPLDDGLDDQRLAVEVAIDKPGTDAGGVRDVSHAGGMEAALDETLLGRLQDALTLARGARGQRRRFCSCNRPGPEATHWSD